MSRPWDEYLGLLEESASLPESEARGVAEAQASYDAEVRRLQKRLAAVDRDLDEFKRRNSRLQLGVREVVRSLGAALPPTSSLPHLAHSELADAMKSAEYDLDQIRKSIDYMRSQHQTPEPAASDPPAPPPAAVVPPPPTPTVNEARTSSRAPVLIAIGIGLVLLIIGAVVLL